MPQSANYFQNPWLTRRFQHDFEEHFPLDSLPARFISVDGNRLGKDFCRDNFLRRLGRGTRLNGWRSGNIGVAKARLLYGARRRGTRVSRSNTASESRAGDYAAGTAGSARSVTIAWSGRHIESACLGNIHRFVLTRLGRYAMGIAKATGLHFLRGALDGLRR